MKKLSIATIVAIIAALIVATVAFAMFSNGNFETGDFTGWIKDATYLNAGIVVGPPDTYTTIPVSSVAGASATDNTFIVNTTWMDTNFGPGNTCDPYSNSEICLPYSGNDSAVVNYLGSMNLAANNMNKLSQSGMIAGGDIGTDGNYHIFFAYAPVLDKGTHPASDQPFMHVRLIRVRSGSPDKVLFDKFSYPDDGNPNWKISPIKSSVKYMPWQVYDLTYLPADLGPGDTLTLEVVAAGCVYTQGAHWGYVYVDEFGPTAPAGDIAPSITSVSPASGPVNGGTTVTISGSNFTSATAVQIDTTTYTVGNFTVVDDNTITVVTQQHTAGTVDISVTNTNGTAAFPGSFTFLNPTITNIAPNTGLTTGGTSVVITGTGFTGMTGVTFGGSAGSCTVDSDTQITCTTPAHAAGTVDVVVNVPGGSATSTGGFTYFTQSISNITPNAGPTAGGTTVVITGVGFTDATGFTFGGTTASCTVDSDTQVTCTTPAHAAGAVDVVITTPLGPITSVGGFTYVPAPSITGIAPSSGPAAGGTTVIITGTDFNGASGFTFGGTTATCTVTSHTQITCTTPAHAAGTVDVVVTTVGGSATSVGGFTYIPAPTITGIVPNSGPTAGGTTVVITGTNFTGATGFTFGGTNASCTVNSDTQITCTSPAHAAGAVNVVVTTGGGPVTSVGGFTYIPQTITNLNPNSGPTSGGTSVVITGTAFTGSTAFTFGGTAATCTVDSDTQITCTTPAHSAGAVDVVVTTPSGPVTFTSGFTYVPATLGLTATGPATVKPGEQYVYTFNYTLNVKPFNAQVKFTLPGHTTFVSNTGGFTCASASGVVTCDLGAVTANGSFTATVLVDKLKKVSTPLTLATTAYSISDNGAALVNGSATVTANTLTPFADVPAGYYSLDFIQSVWAYGITGGCLATNPITYCPTKNITRAEMSVFIERGVHGSTFLPGVLTLAYTDINSNFARYWIQSLANDGITGGCGGTNYCPDAFITRAQMAVFLLRGKYGNTFIPGAPTGTVWLDVSANYWAARWAERLGTDGITAGCGNGNFCPDTYVSRSEMAVLVQRTFNLPLPTP